VQTRAVAVGHGIAWGREKAPEIVDGRDPDIVAGGDKITGQ